MTQAPEIIGRDLLRSKEAGALIGVSARTMRIWGDKGYVPVIRTPSGQRLYRRADVEALLTVNDSGAA